MSMAERREPTRRVSWKLHSWSRAWGMTHLTEDGKTTLCNVKIPKKPWESTTRIRFRKGVCANCNRREDERRKDAWDDVFTAPDGVHSHLDLRTGTDRRQADRRVEERRGDQNTVMGMDEGEEFNGRTQPDRRATHD